MGHRRARRLPGSRSRRWFLRGGQHAAGAVVGKVCRGRRLRSRGHDRCRWTWRCGDDGPSRLGRPRRRHGGGRCCRHGSRELDRRSFDDQGCGGRERHARAGHAADRCRPGGRGHRHARRDLGDSGLGPGSPRLGDRLPRVGPLGDPGRHPLRPRRDRPRGACGDRQRGDRSEPHGSMNEGFHRGDSRGDVGRDMEHRLGLSIPDHCA